jgi:hypothetical protein
LNSTLGDILADKKEIKSIDDYFSDVRGRSHGKLEDSFKHYDEVTDEKALNNMAISIFQPAMDDFYTSFAKQLDEKVKLKNEDSISNDKKAAVQGAAVEALKSFFKKVRPGVLEAIKDVKDVEKQYEILTQQYNSHMGLRGDRGIDAMINGYIDNSNVTVGHLKTNLYQIKGQHVQMALGNLRNQAYSHFLGTYHAPEVSAHVAKKAGEKGYTVTDKVRWAAMDHGELLPVYESVKSGRFEHGPGAYYLKQEVKKEK